MTPIAPLITNFMREHMPQQRGYSPHSCETYAYSFRLLLAFVARRLHTRRVATRLDDQHQRLDRREPCRHIVLALGQLRDVVAGIAQGAQIAATGEGDRIVEGAVPALVGHQSLIRTAALSGASVLLGQMFQHEVAGHLGLGEYLEGRPADLDRATTLMNWTPGRHVASAPVTAGPTWALIADHKRKAVAACAPYFHVLGGAVELQGHP
jgi:hypothetical protein